MSVCSRPPAMKRRRLNQRHNLVNPEFASLYHSEYSTPTAASMEDTTTTPIVFVLGSSRPHQSKKTRNLPVQFPSMMERLKRVPRQIIHNNSMSSSSDLIAATANEQQHDLSARPQYDTSRLHKHDGSIKKRMIVIKQRTSQKRSDRRKSSRLAQKPSTPTH
ncbi:unnamed protein product [Absidia cylindrospora]